MALLELEHVRRSLRRGARERCLLADICMQVEAGELVAVLGARRSGRSTLLRVAAGIEPVDGGIVRFAGRDVSARGAQALGAGIGFCQRPLRGSGSHGVLERLMVGLMARGASAAGARALAGEALERAGASRCATRTMGELDAGEAVRVSLAGALTMEPSLILVDEPVSGVDLLERDAILDLLRSLADEGVAVLMSAGEATALAGADRALSLAEGHLQGSLVPELAEVLPLPARREASEARPPRSERQGRSGPRR